MSHSYTPLRTLSLRDGDAPAAPRIRHADGDGGARRAPSALDSISRSANRLVNNTRDHAPALLLKLMSGEDLTRREAHDLFDALLDEQTTEAQLAALLIALAAKGETVEEIVGMAECLRAHATTLRCRHRTFIDTAGTGASRAKTFNVSTAAAFVCAGAGLPVAKHGNRAVTSRAGSADVLTALGIDINAAPETTERCLNETGIGFMFAPLYHRATARIANVRRALGVYTTFNLLGPLTNPAGAPRQLIGVWHETLLEPLARTLCELGTERAWIVCGADGLDEVSTVAPTHVAEIVDGNVRRFTLTPHDFGFDGEDDLNSLRGGDAATNAQIIRRVLRDENVIVASRGAIDERNTTDGREPDERDLDRRAINGITIDESAIGAARRLVIANAAASLYVGGMAQTLNDATRLATESIDDGAARGKLDALVARTNEVVA